MKHFFVIAFLSVVYFATSQANDMSECVEESGASGQDVANYHKVLVNEPVEDETPELKCFVKCLMQKGEVVSENGSLEKEEMQDKIDEADIPDEAKKELVEMIDECSEISGEDDCDSAFNKLKCMQSKSVKN